MNMACIPHAHLTCNTRSITHAGHLLQHVEELCDEAQVVPGDVRVEQAQVARGLRHQVARLVVVRLLPQVVLGQCHTRIYTALHTYACTHIHTHTHTYTHIHTLVTASKVLSTVINTNLFIFLENVFYCT